MRKKAASEWISYVLLTGFVVAMAAFVYSWMTGYTRGSTEDIKERVFNSELCDSMGLSVVACINSSTSQSLYINVTNRGDLRTTKLTVRLLQLSGSSPTSMHNIEIAGIIMPQQSKILNASNINLTWAVNANTTVEVIPETEKEGFLIVCNDKSGEATFANC